MDDLANMRIDLDHDVLKHLDVSELSRLRCLLEEVMMLTLKPADLYRSMHAVDRLISAYEWEAVACKPSISDYETQKLQGMNSGMIIIDDPMNREPMSDSDRLDAQAMVKEHLGKHAKIIQDKMKSLAPLCIPVDKNGNQRKLVITPLPRHSKSFFQASMSSSIQRIKDTLTRIAQDRTDKAQKMLNPPEIDFFKCEVGACNGNEFLPDEGYAKCPCCGVEMKVVYK